MKTIAASEFKAKCLQLLDQVKERKDEITILKHGVPVAVLRAYEKKGKSDPFETLRGSVRWKGDPLRPALGESDIEALR